MSWKQIAETSVVLLVAGLILSGITWLVWYAATAPREGIVRSAWLEPAHSETYQSGSVCISYDDKGSCTMSMPIYATRWVPDRCWVVLDDVERSKRQATWPIWCNEIDQYPVGEWRKVS